MDRTSAQAADPVCLRHLTRGTSALPITSPSGERVSGHGDGTLIVGDGVHIKGSLDGCDTVIIKGRVDASFKADSVLVLEGGTCLGSVETNNAEIAGTFDGTLAVKHCLKVRASGCLSGTIRYARIHVEEGGEISGELQIGGNLPPPLRWRKSKPRSSEIVESVEAAGILGSKRRTIKDKHSEPLSVSKGPTANGEPLSSKDMAELSS